MSPPTGSVAPEAEASRFGRFWAPLLIAIAGVAAYANSLSGPFVFDDVGSIPDNPTIRHLWPIGPVLSPLSGGSTVSGRPLLNLTLAVNYAFGGTEVWGYHAVNLVIHILAALTLFGIVRRMLRSNAVPAFVIALIWTVHPLQTESVTYLIQRAESLMGLFYLLTIYCFCRYAERGSSFAKASEDPEAGRRIWAGLSVLACLLGMATKENMVSAPLVVLLYDRTFLAGSFREAWRRRWPAYLGLAGTWLLLGYLVLSGGGNRSGSMGFDPGVPWWGYRLTQFQALAHYLWLVVWPHPLAFEYGIFWVQDAGQVVPYACIVGALLAATILALWRWPAWGFLGFWFFAILAPTSLVSTATQMIVEHRMYLALAPVLVAIVCGGSAASRWASGRKGGASDFRGAAGLGPAGATKGFAASAWIAALIVFAGVCGFLTAARNEDYRSEEVLWTDTVAKRPENALAHNNLGKIWANMPGRANDAIAQLEWALRLNPGLAEVHNNLGNVWANTPGRLNDAIAQFEAALRLNPDYAEAHYNLGNALAPMPGRLNDAIAQYREALRLRPGIAEARNNLGYALYLAGQTPEAVAQYEEAVRLKADYWEAHFNLAAALLRLPGRGEEAKRQLEAVLRLQPQNDAARQLLARIQTPQP